MNICIWANKLIASVAFLFWFVVFLFLLSRVFSCHRLPVGYSIHKLLLTQPDQKNQSMNRLSLRHFLSKNHFEVSLSFVLQTAKILDSNQQIHANPILPLPPPWAELPTSPCFRGASPRASPWGKSRCPMEAGIVVEMMATGCIYGMATPNHRKGTISINFWLF